MAKHKHEVEVTLRAETVVRMFVWVEEGDEVTDLTQDEERTACNLASGRAMWSVEQVREVTTKP